MSGNQTRSKCPKSGQVQISYICCSYSHFDLNLVFFNIFSRLEKGENVDPNKEFLKLDGESGLKAPKERVHLTLAELNGLKFMVMYLHYIPANKKNVPILLPDPIALIRVSF